MEILNDFSTNIIRALSEIDPNWRDYEGLIICGTHNPHDTEDMIEKIKKARENNLPTLLICFGHQLGWIEYCRSVLGIKDATSEEFGQGTFVVKRRKERKIGLHEGESWWSYFECDRSFIKTTKVDVVGEAYFYITKNYPYEISVPYHPEYQSFKGKPHPLLVKFLYLCSVK